MSYEIDGKTIEANEKGYLVNLEDWTEAVAKGIASAQGVELTERSMDVIAFLREEYIENRENQPNTRAIIKAMSKEWGEKISQKDLYALFPGDPSKQGGMIAGLPESRRKGGY